MAKRPGSKAGHLPHPVPRVRMNVAVNPPPSFAYMACAGTDSSSSIFSMALQSIADPRLLNGLIPVSCFLLPLFPICNFSFINICFYTIPPSVSWSSPSRLPLGLLLNTWLTFLLLSTLLIWPIHFSLIILTNQIISKSPNSSINSSLYRFFQFLFNLNTQTIFLKIFISKVANRLAISSFSTQDSAPYIAPGRRQITFTWRENFITFWGMLACSRCPRSVRYQDILVTTMWKENVMAYYDTFFPNLVGKTK